MQILLAEDNEANRILVRSLLEREGHKLDFAENGAIALSRCEHKKYDLILMDILMPIMDGVKTLRQLRRSDGLNAQTPIFALTGYSSPTDKRRYQQVGFDIVLTKPLRPNDLSYAWNSYLKGDASIAPVASISSSNDFDNIALIDDELIGQLLISGTQNEIKLIAEGFWVSTRDFIALIQENLNLAMRGQNDALTALRRAAHALKGSAATIGLLRMSRISATLQNAPADRIGPLVLKLIETITPSAEALQEKIIGGDKLVKSDSSGAHFDDVNVRRAPSQTLS